MKEGKKPWLCRIGFHDDESFGWGRGFVCLRCERVKDLLRLALDRKKRAEQLTADGHLLTFYPAPPSRVLPHGGALRVTRKPEILLDSGPEKRG